MKSSHKFLLYILSAFAFIGLVYFEMQPPDLKINGPRNDVSYATFMKDALHKDIHSIVVQEGYLYGVNTQTGHTEVTYGPFSESMAVTLVKEGVNVVFPDPNNRSVLSVILMIVKPLLPMLIILGVAMKMSNNQIFQKKSPLTWVDGDGNTVRFKDIQGVDEAKAELMEIVDYLKRPEDYTNLGGKVPKGALMSGPQGTGKTMLAKAIAGEASVPFAHVSGSDFVEMFVGVGAQRVRSMFQEARNKAPCILFIDEIEVVGRARGNGAASSGGSNEYEQTLNQILVEMDGFKTNDGVIVIAATNRPDILDPALTRPGRFDRLVSVGNPDVTGREAILRVHTEKKTLADDVFLDTIARATPGFSGAELQNLVNEAALYAARHKMTSINHDAFEYARDKIMMGAERRSLKMTERDVLVTSYHEAGHALCNILLKHCDPLHKVTIIPRGQALGVTFTLPKDDKLSLTQESLEDRLVMTMGGRAAEYLLGDSSVGAISNGASGDIKQATSLAREMVMHWGMFPQKGAGLSLMDYSQSQSQQTHEKIDNAVQKLIDEAYQEALSLLSDHKDKLHILAQELMKHETLDEQQVRTLLSL